MDALKNAISGNKTNTQGDAAAQGQKSDYLDKAAEFGVKKSGHEGQFSREQQEKATDGARGLYEKATGNAVNSKFSN